MTDYGTATGLKGINCYHDFGVYFEGMERFAMDTLNRMNERRVYFQGESLSYYEALQRERQIERTYSKWERQANALKSAGLDATKAEQKMEEWRQNAMLFSKTTGIHRNIYFD